MVDKNKKLNLTEHVNTLFEGVEASDELKQKVETVLEATITSEVAAQVAVIQEQTEAKILEGVEAEATQLEETVNKYLDYVVSEFMAENKVAVDTGLKVEMMESFITGMKDLFAENYVEVPAEKANVLADLESKVAELSEKLNATSAKNIELAEEIEDFQKGQVFVEAAAGLTDTQREKLGSLVEGVDFGNAEAYATKVKTIRESFFKSEEKESEKESKQLTEENQFDHGGHDSRMAKYKAAYQTK